LSAADRRFIEHAAEGGRMEVALGRLAADHASNSDVKSFGQMMVTDHSKANSELESLAQQKGVTLPAEKTDSKQNQLSKLSGDQFDRRYVAMMLSDHQKDVAEFEKMSRSASDPDVKSFAAKTLPTLQMHLDRVKMLSQNTTGGSHSGASNTGDTNHGGSSGNSSNTNRVNQGSQGTSGSSTGSSSGSSSSGSRSSNGGTSSSGSTSSTGKTQ